MNKKTKVNYYWLLIAGAIIVPVSMLLPLSHNVQAQQNSTGFANKMAAPPTIPTANWTGSVQILPTIMQAFKSQIHINLNEATTNALQAVGTNSILSLILYHFITFISAICI